MAESHPSFPQPEDTGVSVWRYIDLSKFVWMLQRKALYFTRADLLGDPYEAYYTRAMADPTGFVEGVVVSAVTSILHARLTTLASCFDATAVALTPSGETVTTKYGIPDFGG
jgi:hypothetical protein